MKKQQTYDVLQKISNEINDKLPEKMGFILLAYEFGDKKDKRNMIYTSNSNRTDIVKAMLQIIYYSLKENKKKKKNDI